MARKRYQAESLSESEVAVLAMIYCGYDDLYDMADVLGFHAKRLAQTVVTQRFSRISAAGIRGCPIARLPDPVRCMHCGMLITAIPCSECVSAIRVGHWLPSSRVIIKLTRQSQDLLNGDPADGK